MEIVITVVALLVFVAGVFSNRNKFSPPEPPAPPSPTSVLAETAIPLPIPSIPTPPLVPAFSPTSTAPASNNLADYIYPGAAVLSSSGQSLSLTSSDNPDQVTNWYKEKIKNMGFSSKAFAETRANDKVLNKLTGDNGQLSIAIEIAKDSAESAVTIQVSLTPK